MDAKPQRALRTLASFYGNEENSVSTMFNANHQRQKSAVGPIFKDAAASMHSTLNAVKIPAKRTAFGDVSNMPRPFAEAAVYGGKAKVAVKTTTLQVANAAPLPASVTSGKENAAGFMAPAQRAKSNGVSAPATAVQPQSQLQLKRGQQTSLESRDSLPEPLDTSAKITKSPRHYKSQPCLKRASFLEQSQEQQQQQPGLRRTKSRLPVEQAEFKVIDAATLETDSSVSEAKPEEEEGAFSALLNNGVVDSIDLAILEELQESADLKAVAEAVAVLEEESLAAAATVPLEPTDLLPLSPKAEHHVHCLSDLHEPISTATSAPVSEAEEPWDDDADFYDDQGYTTAHSFRSLGDNTTGGLTTIMMPKVTAKIQNELDAARAIVEASITPEEIDDEAWDISMVAEYGDDIHSYMKELEAKMLPSPHYMDMQTEIQWSMRAVLMEWLIQVHARFNLLPETLFLTVNYIDRFLSSKIVSVTKLQLVGATAIFIASKYEEITCPSIQEIVYMVDGGYSTEEILKAERFMLNMLGFELGWPGPMSFLRRISKADDYDLETRTLAKYFLEVTVMDERFVACPPSFLAAGAHCLARLMLYKGDWSVAHTHYSGYTWSQVRPLANVILQCCHEPRAHHAAVYEKYASSKFKRASLYVEEEVSRGFTLPSLYSRQRLSMTQSFADSFADSDSSMRSDHLDMMVAAES